MWGKNDIPGHFKEFISELAFETETGIVQRVSIKE